MSDIILYIGIIVVSGIVGSRVRAYRDKLGWTSTIQTMAIVLLVLLMGARMGANEEIIANLGSHRTRVFCYDHRDDARFH